MYAGIRLELADQFGLLLREPKDDRVSDGEVFPTRGGSMFSYRDANSYRTIGKEFSTFYQLSVLDSRTFVLRFTLLSLEYVRPYESREL